MSGIADLLVTEYDDLRRTLAPVFGLLLVLAAAELGVGGRLRVVLDSLRARLPFSMTRK